MIWVTSGCADMIWSAAASSSLPLYLRSPMARDRFRLPLTLHCEELSVARLQLQNEKGPSMANQQQALDASDALVPIHCT